MYIHFWDAKLTDVFFFFFFFTKKIISFVISFIMKVSLFDCCFLFYTKLVEIYWNYFCNLHNVFDIILELLFFFSFFFNNGIFFFSNFKASRFKCKFYRIAKVYHVFILFVTNRISSRAEIKIIIVKNPLLNWFLLWYYCYIILSKQNMH